MTHYSLMIYKRDGRTKSGERLVGTYPYRRRYYEDMVREVNELRPLYPSKLGYHMVIAVGTR
jgi:hypothetical protein